LAYLFGAYLVLWALAFGYLFFLGTRQRRLERELSTVVKKETAAAAGSEESV
jgi:CcmD family protein